MSDDANDPKVKEEILAELSKLPRGVTPQFSAGPEQRHFEGKAAANLQEMHDSP
jgi:hypothetical protein